MLHGHPHDKKKPPSQKLACKNKKTFSTLLSFSIIIRIRVGRCDSSTAAALRYEFELLSDFHFAIYARTLVGRKSVLVTLKLLTVPRCHGSGLEQIEFPLKSKLGNRRKTKRSKMTDDAELAARMFC